jgi:hypothetical protein
VSESAFVAFRTSNLVSVAWIEQREIRVLTVGGPRISFHSIRATLAGLKNPQTEFTENSMKPTTAIHLVTVAALAILTLAAARPARAQQGAIHPPELDMPDATRGKIGITHKSLLKLVDSANGVYGKYDETGDSFCHYRCAGDAQSRHRKTGAGATRRGSSA